MGANVESTLHGDGVRNATRYRFAPFHAADVIYFPALIAFLWLGNTVGICSGDYQSHRQAETSVPLDRARARCVLRRMARLAHGPNESGTCAKYRAA